MGIKATRPQLDWPSWPHSLFPKITNGDKQGSIHKPYCNLAGSLKILKTYNTRTTEINSMEYIGIINFQYFVSGYFHGANFTIENNARRKRTTENTP